MRLRFTIRDLLWLTIVVALAAGWWIDRRGMLSRIESLDASQQMRTLRSLERALKSATTETLELHNENSLYRDKYGALDQSASK